MKGTDGQCFTSAGTSLNIKFIHAVLLLESRGSWCSDGLLPQPGAVSG